MSTFFISADNGFKTSHNWWELTARTAGVYVKKGTDEELGNFRMFLGSNSLDTYRNSP